MRQVLSSIALLVFGASLVGCSVDEVPEGLRRTPPGDGATVRWDLYHKPLPEIPFPNDQAMWPDPTSRTGMRVNASTVAPTHIEESARRKFDELEGFGTFGAITVGFNKAKANDGRPAIDLENVKKRHQGDDYELDNDAIYVVNLSTGVPAVIDLGEGSFQYTLRDKGKYWRNDTRVTEQNLLFETVDETIDPKTGKQRPESLIDGVPVYKPEWDTDYDGVLDRPNLIDPKDCANQVDVALGNVKELDRDRCLSKSLVTFYERESDTLVFRPLLPLEEKTEYAVVITDRLLDADGKPVRSPFDFVYHPAEEDAMARLQAHLSNKSLASYYGDIGGTGLAHVQFAWTFTTQPVEEDLRLIRDGLYGKGPFSKLAKQFPAKGNLSRAAGLVSVEDMTADPPTEEPPDWESDKRCTDKVKNFYIVKFSTVKETLKELAKQGFGIEGPALDTLIASFNSISHIAMGEFESPFFIDGGPKGTDPNASFQLDYRTGQGKIYKDKVQFLIVVPKSGNGRAQPFPVAYYGHGYSSSSIEALGFAGHLAAQGIASVGMNATFHGIDLGQTELDLAHSLFRTACEAPFASALLSGRARDLDGNGTLDSGGDYWTSYLFHTRDVVRQSAVDLLQMFRTLKSYDGQRLANPKGLKVGGRLDQDYDGNGVADDLAGDFDGDGTPDVGGPKSEYYAWGQSLGAILAPFVAALDPDIVATAPTSGSGGLLNLAARTIQGGAFEGIYLRDLGPIVVGVSGKELIDAGKQKETKCTADQISLRFVALDVNNDREVEFHCIDKAPYAKAGGTVLVTNGKNGLVRCGRMDSDGHFRIGIPTNLGDKLEVQVWDQPDAVDAYGEDACNPTLAESHRIELINTWGDGVIPNNAPDPVKGSEFPVCTETSEGGCSKFQNKYYPKGAKLTAIMEGFGLIRQTPALRRLLNLGSQIIDPGDPINYAPYYALKPLPDPDGKPAAPKGALNIVTIGDMNVPLDSGIALGRAAGAVPFLVPDAASRYPALADYVTPADLYSALQNKTPNRFLIDHHVLEGTNRLQWEAPADLTSCQPNEVPVTAADVVCHPNCTQDNTSSCLSGQSCVNDRCVKNPISEADCAASLFDPDVLDEGMATWGEHEATVPLRLARVAMPASPSDLSAIWAPRLEGKPFASDTNAWTPDKRVLAQLQGYIIPKGDHGFETADPCQAWDSGQYLINLIGRFFKSSGSDLYYLSHPSSHNCLVRPTGTAGSCDFIFIPQ